MKVSIIIINYNTPELVYDCLGSLEGKLDVPYEVIVVDNGSHNKLDEQKLHEFTGISYIDLATNRGFGGGNNAGARLARGEILWFLNSDTLIPDDTVDQVFTFLDRHPDIGIVSPLLYNDLAQGQMQPDFYADFQSLRSVLLRNPRKRLDLKSEYFETDVVVGASLFIRRNLFEKINGFDEKIFMYFDDDDLCYRVRKLGYKVAVYTRAKIIHLQGKSISRQQERKRFYYRSQDYFWQKHYGSLPALLMKTIRFPYKLWKTL